MQDMPVQNLLDHVHDPVDTLRLDYEARLVRRKRLLTQGGRGILLDLPDLTDLTGYGGLLLQDGTEIALEAASEPVLIVRGGDRPLARLAWHIGNRHTPCQIAEDYLVIRADHVLHDMLLRLGAEVAEASRPFHPEGGAYGHGRTMGHAHDH